MKTGQRNAMMRKTVILFSASIAGCSLPMLAAQTFGDDDYWATLASENEVRTYNGTGERVCVCVCLACPLV